MKRSFFLPAFVAAALMVVAIALPAQGQTDGQTGAPPAALTPAICKAGPVDKTFGGTKWQVYGCKDSKSLVIVSAPGNPATPFYFTFSPSPEGHYRLEGAGTGLRDATAAAFDDLKSLSQQDFATLLAQTKAMAKP